MFNRYALLLSLASAGGPLFAQDLVILKDTEGNTVNGQVVVHIGDPSATVHEVDILANLQGNVGKTLNLKRYETQLLAGTFNYFCWGVCYGALPSGGEYLWESAHPVIMSPGVDVSNFHAYMEPHGIEGVTRFRFVWFDVDVPTDTAWVDIEFRSEAVGIHEAVASQYELSVFPNPSMGADVRVNFTATAVSPATRLVVYNALGEAVHTETVRPAQQSVVIGAGELSTGVYFATLENNATMLATQRFVVTGR